MTIYLAVCDDNIAQRKQTERLLNREKDSRLKTSGDVLYIDSFGSSDALLKTPVKYDMFFLDVTNESQNALDIATTLRQKGIIAPIVLCSSTIAYRELDTDITNLYHIDMPLDQKDLAHMIDVALAWSAAKPPLIEIRCQTTTFYVSCDDIIKVKSVDTLLTDIHLSDGTIIQMTDSLANLYNTIKIYGSFIILGKTMINAASIEEPVPGGFKLIGGEIIKYNIFQKKDALARYEHYKSNL